MSTEGVGAGDGGGGDGGAAAGTSADARDDIDYHELSNQSKAKTEEFFAAAMLGDIERMKQLLPYAANSKADIDVRATPAARLSALHWAAHRNSAEMIRLLVVEHKVDVNQGSRSDILPIHVAAGAGNLEAIDVLLELRADVNALESTRISPLQFACKRGSLACVQSLLSAHANLDHVDAEGSSVLFHATEAPTLDVLEYFLAKNVRDIRGIGKHAVNYRGRTLVYTAAMFGQSQTVQLLLELKCDVVAAHSRPAPILAAAACGNAPSHDAVACVETLLAARADPAVVDVGIGSQGANIFHAAAGAGNPDLIAFLAHSSIFGDDCGSSAVAATDHECGKMMMMINARDREGRTPLHWAAIRSRVDAVSTVCICMHMHVVIARKADAEAENDGYSAVFSLSVRLFHCFLFSFLICCLRIRA